MFATSRMRTTITARTDTNARLIKKIWLSSILIFSQNKQTLLLQHEQIADGRQEPEKNIIVCLHLWQCTQHGEWMSK